MRRLRQSRRLKPPLRSVMHQVPARPALSAAPVMRPGTGRSLLASSLLLVLAPSAHALTLGEISVRSALGQPLNATVPLRLGAGEALASGCVVPVQQPSELRHVPGASVTTPEAMREGQYELRVSSASSLYEPMYELELKVKCPGSPVVVRQYVLMLDLPAAIASAAALPGVATLQATGSAAVPLSDAKPTSPAVQPRAARPRATAARPGTTITSGSVYRVSDGDTLSGIAARVRDRNVSLRVLADAIQAANSDAFIRNDANLIKLGSEILIPSPAANSAPAAASVPPLATTPAVPPAPVVMAAPLLAAAPEIPAGTATSAPASEVLLPGAQTESAQSQATETQPARTQAAPVAVARRTVTPKTVAAPADDTVVAGPDEANPAAAAGAGVLFGLCISALLWFRGRLPSRKRQLAKPVASKAPSAGKAPNTGSPTLSGSAPLATVVQPLVTRTVEPGFSVSYSDQYDDSLEATFAAEPKPAAIVQPLKAPQAGAAAPGDEITSELEKLFDSTDTTIRKRLDAQTAIAPRSSAGEANDAFEPAEVESGNAVDFFVGELADDEDEAMAAQTTDLARPNIASTSATGSVDIHALATSATKDEQQAQTLLEALTLLERDYEEELTASQVLDMSAVRKVLGNNANDATQLGEELLRKKAR